MKKNELSHGRGKKELINKERKKLNKQSLDYSIIKFKSNDYKMIRHITKSGWDTIERICHAKKGRFDKI